MSTEIPKTQKQWEHTKRAVPKESLQLNEAPVARPAKGSGDVLVKVKAVGLNHEWQTFHIFPTWLRKLPAVPELEMSGVIVDPGESNWKVGDEVCGFVSPHLPNSPRGALCQYVLCKAVHIIPKPKSLSFEQASGISACGLTAYRSIFVYNKYENGQRIFINGGSTLVGRYAIQIAKANGAYVVASCSEAMAETLRSLGADETVDYKSSPLHLQLASKYPYSSKKSTDSSKSFNLIIDTVGSSEDLYWSSPKYLLPSGKTVRPGGDLSKGFLHFVWQSLKNTLIPGWLPGGTPRGFTSFATSFGDKERVCDQIQILADLVEAGKLRVDVDSVNGYDKEGVLAAYDKSASGKARGKIVIQVSSD